MAVLGIVRGHYGVQSRFGGSQIRKDRSQLPKQVVSLYRRGTDPFPDSRPTGLNRPLGGCKQVVFGCLIVRQLGCLYHLRTTVGSIWCNLLCFLWVVRVPPHPLIVHETLRKFGVIFWTAHNAAYSVASKGEAGTGNPAVEALVKKDR